MIAPSSTIRGALEPALRKAAKEFRVHGTLAGDGRLYPIGTDSKQLAAIFEQFTAPHVRRLADRQGRTVYEAPQTVDPDFTLARGENDPEKIAIDVKTTYRRSSGGAVFTMGSYTSYLRDGEKNILFPYEEYSEHWVIGVVYDRNDEADGLWEPVPATEPDRLPCPFKRLEVFVQERHRIAGTRPGSSNTSNIGSIRARSIEAFRRGDGPFAPYPPEVFAGYWSRYPQHTSLADYLEATDREARRAVPSEQTRLIFTD